MNPVPLQARRFDVEDSYDGVPGTIAGSRDGPMGCPWSLPPRDLVRRMLMGFGEDPSVSLGIIQPRNARVYAGKRWPSMR